MDKLVSICKQYGFIFQGSEIYGGLANTWDYGPLGVELKNNLKVASKKYKIEREQRIKYLLEDLENNVMQLKNMQVQRQKTNKWLKAVYQAIKQK